VPVRRIPCMALSVIVGSRLLPLLLATFPCGDAEDIYD
jgi:hypothetical protein